MAAADYRLLTEATGQRIAAALENIALLNIDATPTQGSTNAVQSGGVYNAIQQSTADMTVKTSNSWGTTVSWTQNNGLSMIMIGNYHLVIVWGASTSDVNVLVINPNGSYSKSGKNNEVKFGGVSTDETFTITRSNNSMTLTCATNQTVKVLT